MWVLRIVCLLMWVLFGFVSVQVIWPLLNQHQRNAYERFWSRGVLTILRIKVVLNGHWPRPPVMLVINHVSWSDILAINSISPSAFIAKSEISSWPIAGTLASRAGTIFVERGKRHAVRAVIHEATAALNAGRTVAVFPEGTTTDGTGLLPFHSNMLQSSIEAVKLVVPMCLHYTRKDGTLTTEPAFIGEQTMLENFMVLVKHPQGFVVTLTPLPAIHTHDDQNQPFTRHLLAEQAHKAVSEELAKVRANA